MKPALAKTRDVNPLEDLGRATLQVVHDLKNQLNGLKLYATFLRKRLEQANQSPEERETLGKLVAGLDRAARDLSALVRYSRPLELQPQRCDLRKIIPGAAQVTAGRNSGDLTRSHLNCEIENRAFPGQFDATTLTEAFDAITEEAVSGVPQRDLNQVSLHVGLADSPGAPRAMIEWRGAKPAHRNPSFTSFHDQATVHMALAAKIIEAHGGQIERDANTIRVSLPLSD
jgi:nitrogen fixation/metabolism regulation signal transduction histidine kinase